MVYGVSDDVRNVLVNERVHGLSAVPLDVHQPGVTQHPKMLRDKRLAHPQSLHQFVDVTRPCGQLDHDGQAGRRGQHPE